MTARLRIACLTAACAAGFLATSPRATADQINLFFNTATNAPTVQGTLNGSPTQPLTPGPYYFTQNNVPINSSFPPPTVTFCAQVTEFVSTGKSYEFNVTSVAALPTVGNQTKADYITELWGRHYDTAWNSTSFASKPPSDPAYTDSIAFQLALWEVIYDGPFSPNGLNLAGGNFTVPGVGSGNAVYDAAYLEAKSWLSELTGKTSYFNNRFSGYSLAGLTDPTDPKGKPSNPQDQITMIPKAVPAPPGAVLAGIGFIGLIGRARWLRRKPAAV